MLVVVDSRISSSVGVCGKCVQCASQRSGHSLFVSCDPSGWWVRTGQLMETGHDGISEREKRLDALLIISVHNVEPIRKQFKHCPSLVRDVALLT